jgi:serine/threonine protein kinase
MPNELVLGSVLDDRFKITDFIGEGGMASIYEAIDTTTGEVVAIKVPFLRFESDPAFYSRFEREEQVGRKLHHPSILRVITVETKSRPYIVMERLEGVLLSESLKDRKPLPIPQAIQITVRIGEALEYMHERGVVHRDIKPSNIMLCRDGSLRVLDFGLAKGLEEKQVTFMRHAPEMGTPDYMAPEQVQGGSRGGRTDLYSLGAVLYEMVTGRKPFTGSDRFSIMHARLVGDPVAPRSINPEISPALEEIILYAMERDYQARYPSVREFILDLKDPEKVKPTGRAERLIAPTSGKLLWRKVRVTVWAFGVLLVLVGIYVLSRRR